jgi:glutamyl-tRNA synthetase
MAPSPTGMVHVGNARTALFNWLYVRHFDGTLILRIEDTDAERDREEWIDGIIDSLHWLGIEWDEGPSRQSANRAAHVAAGEMLYQKEQAYYCDCTREQIDARKSEGQKPGYDNFCRDRNLGPGEGRALRFRVPSGHTIVRDLVRGNVDFDNANIEDFVLVRSNGIPVYVLANAIDDLNDEVTHVVRGEEHLPNAPKQMLIWQSLSEIPVPIYAHLPVIVNEKRQKLSKRRDKVALEMYRDEGFLPEAMRNYLALLGWSPKGDREIVPVETLISEFDFADVQKSSAFFDVQKLTAFNGDYIRALSLDEFVVRCEPFLAASDMWPRERFNPDVFAAIAPLVQERVARLDEVAAMVDFFFVDTVTFEPAAMKVMDNEAQRAVLQDAIAAYADCEWTHAALHDVTLKIGEAHGLKLGKAQAPIRLAVTGKKVGPPLFESLELLGRSETIDRLTRLRDAAQA